MLEVRVLDGAGVRAHVEDVRRIHGACFPEDVDDEDAEGAGGHPDDAFWDRLTACHDADDVLWFLLVRDARAGDPEPHGARHHEIRTGLEPRWAKTTPKRPRGKGIGNAKKKSKSSASRRRLGTRGARTACTSPWTRLCADEATARG